MFYRAVEGDVTPDRKAVKSRRVLAKSSYHGARREEFTFLLNGIDELIGSSEVFGGDVSGYVQQSNFRLGSEDNAANFPRGGPLRIIPFRSRLFKAWTSKGRP